MATFNPSEQALLQQALGALRATTGLGFRIVEGLRGGPDYTADSVVEIDFNGRTAQYHLLVKEVDRFATLGPIKNQMDEHSHPTLLVAPRIAPEIADKCRKLDLPFIDTAGNAYLRAPGVLVFIKGQRLPPEPQLSIGQGSTATGLRIVFALLCHPELVNAPYREIARTAGVALGAIGSVFTDLTDRGHILATKGNHGIIVAASASNVTEEVGCLRG